MVEVVQSQGWPQAKGLRVMPRLAVVARSLRWTDRAAILPAILVAMLIHAPASVVRAEEASHDHAHHHAAAAPAAEAGTEVAEEAADKATGKTQDETAPAAAKPRPANVGGIEDPQKQGGIITGDVVFEGKLYPRRPILMGTDAFCQTAHPDTPLLDERWVFGKRFGDEKAALQNVFVFVSKGLENHEFELPTTPAVLDQVGCVYIPHVLGVVAGQPIKVLNSDATLHNVNMNSKHNGGFNEGMPVKGMELEKTFKTPEMAIVLKCDVHPWMASYVQVMSHPFFAVTQEDGSFSITGLPPGEYEVSVWHEFERFKPVAAMQRVTVETGKTSEPLHFIYRPPDAK